MAYVLFILCGDWLLLAWILLGSVDPIRLIEWERVSHTKGIERGGIALSSMMAPLPASVLMATNPAIGKQTLQGINLSETIWLLLG